jgi:hypothetical protein
LLEGFNSSVSFAWLSCSNVDATRNIATKMKACRSALKKWIGSKSSIKILVHHCNLVIAFLDKLEELRPLFLPENNFRLIIKNKLQQLIFCQQVYWKQRYTENLVKWGDENTKFFHARATEMYRHNTISQIIDDDGRVVTEHFEKVALFWNEFKSRMGVSVSPQMQFDLDTLFDPVDLQSLVDPVSNDEMDNIIRSLTNDKAPGPDGFNGHFFKRCWNLIKYDMYRLCRGFFNHQVNLQAINSSFITLVPKKPNPEKVSDFRPISLLNSSMKFITKILANRLQSIILQVVHKNQYGFLHGRTIQDCLG